MCAPRTLPNNQRCNARGDIDWTNIITDDQQGDIICQAQISVESKFVCTWKTLPRVVPD